MGNPVALLANALLRLTRGVHLDDVHSVVEGADGELHVGPPGLDSDRSDDNERLVAQRLVLAVGQGLGWGDRDRVAGVHAHGIEVLDGTDDDDVVGEIAHDLQLELLPAEHALLDQDLVGRRKVEAVHDDLAELVLVVGDAPAFAPQGVAGADDGRQPDFFEQCLGLSQRAGGAGGGHRQTVGQHAVLEPLAVLGNCDGLWTGADQLDAVLGQDARLVKFHRQVQPGLPAHGRQQGVGPLARDDLASEVDGERLDVGGISDVGVRHDRGGIAIEQDHAVAQLLQGLARLCARIVELTGLANHDGTGADDEDGLDVGTERHAGPPGGARL